MNTTSSTRRLSRFIATLAAVAAAAAALTGCSMANGGTHGEPVVSQNVQDSESVLKALEDVQEITAKKSVFSLGDHWTVTADGVELGEISGQFIYVIGDTYSLFSKEGNLVDSESEGYRVVYHKAKTYDYNNQQRGEIQQKFSPFLSKYDFVDITGDVIGRAEQKFNIAMNFNINNKHGEGEYNISKKMFSLGSHVTVKPLTEERAVKAIDALWLAVIASEVEDSKSSDSNSKNNS